MQTAQNDNGFLQITSHNLKEAKAPAKITLPKELVSGMQDAWDKSFPKGKSQEQGGILVRHKDGSYEWKAGKGRKSESFKINYEDIGKNETLVMTGHTHPYDKSEGGYTEVSFSAADLANLVVGKEPAKIVQSGQTLFVVARTTKFDGLLKNSDTKQKLRLYTRIKKMWYKVFNLSKGHGIDRIEVATRLICERYHLVYYKGKGNLLTKVDTSSQNDKDTK